MAQRSEREREGERDRCVSVSAGTSAAPSLVTFLLAARRERRPDF